MRLLDAFSGEGGAAVGYRHAGFHVTGVDNRAIRYYAGDELLQADAIGYLDAFAALRVCPPFDLVHASPPCQGYSPHVSSRSSEYAGTAGKDEPRLIGAVRELLLATGLPYVIENVVGARHELRPNLLLCGTTFGLPIPRHRLFETSFPVAQPWHPPCSGVAKRYAEAKGWDPRDMTVTGKGRRAGTLDRWKEVMGWPDFAGTQHGMREAIPPVYAAYVGAAFLATLEQAA